MIPISKNGKSREMVRQLKYSTAFERWDAYDGDMYCYSIHCGDGFCMRVKDSYFAARMELDTQWYVWIDHDKFRLHTKQTYDIMML